MRAQEGDGLGRSEGPALDGVAIGLLEGQSWRVQRRTSRALESITSGPGGNASPLGTLL